MNQGRRRFLRFLLIGGGTVLSWNLFGSVFRFFSKPSEKETTDLKNFRMIEKGNNVIFYDKSGEEILILEN